MPLIPNGSLRFFGVRPRICSSEPAVRPSPTTSIDGPRRARGPRLGFLQDARGQVGQRTRPAYRRRSGGSGGPLQRTWPGRPARPIRQEGGPNWWAPARLWFGRSCTTAPGARCHARPRGQRVLRGVKAVSGLVRTPVSFRSSWMAIDDRSMLPCMQRRRWTARIAVTVVVALVAWASVAQPAAARPSNWQITGRIRVQPGRHVVVLELGESIPASSTAAISATPVPTRTAARAPVGSRATPGGRTSDARRP